jgi:hypothetical protein
LTSLSAPRKASVALLIGAFALSACGGGTPSPAASTGGAASAGPTTAATTPVSTEPSAAATDVPATGGAAVDPADDLKIAAPYTLEPLDEQIAAMFVNAMKQSVSGENANLVQFGFRTAAKDGTTEAWVIVMGFPGLPIAGNALLDKITESATAGGGTVEDLTIGGNSARYLEQGGQSLVLMLNGDELLMIVGTAKKATVDVAKAIGEAN